MSGERSMPGRTSGGRAAASKGDARLILFSLLALWVQQPLLGAAFSFCPRTKTRASSNTSNGGGCQSKCFGSGIASRRHNQSKDTPAAPWANGSGCSRASRSGLGGLSAELSIGEPQTLSSESPYGDTQTEGFDWKRQWYPVAVVRDLEAMDPREPYPVKLLGEALVIWKDPKSRGWKAFADRCPHRWAPLSEGRVDQKTGRLQCIYHGWEFESDGKCGSIPQADPAARGSAQNSRRACATVVPTKVVQGKLWLWPDVSPEGVAASELKSPAVVPELDGEEFGGNWYMRELEYGYDTLLENLSDPAHVPFAHHGVIGNRAMGSTSMGIEMEEGLGPDEFRTKGTGYMGQKNLRVGFEAPSLVYYCNEYTETFPALLKRLPPVLKVMAWAIKTLNLDHRMTLAMKNFYEVLNNRRLDDLAGITGEEVKDPSDRLLSYFIGYAVPTTPGKCRIITRTARNFFLQHPVIPRKWRNSLAGEHLGQHLVLDGDSVALHVQERALVKEGKHGSADAERTFFMPTDADAPVRACRKWYNSRGGGGPPWARGVDPLDLGPVLPHKRALDRFEGHTKHCSACSKAHRVSGKAKRASAGAALLLLAAATAAPRGVLALGLAGSALVSSGLSLAMAKREKTFVFVDYVHATRDG